MYHAVRLVSLRDKEGWVLCMLLRDITITKPKRKQKSSWWKVIPHDYANLPAILRVTFVSCEPTLSFLPDSWIKGVANWSVIGIIEQPRHANVGVCHELQRTTLVIICSVIRHTTAYV